MDQAAEPVPAQRLGICTQGRWIRIPSRRGLLQRPVRPVVFVLVGFFLVKAAVLSSATQTKGLDAVFRSVASSPAALGCWACSRPACSATAFTAWPRLATAT
jgi:hypothetical protein